MHIAVEQGFTKQSPNFAQCVDYLYDEHIIPKNAKDWVDEIRKKGNEANHEIVLMDEDDAKRLLDFTE